MFGRSSAGVGAGRSGGVEDVVVLAIKSKVIRDESCESDWRTFVTDEPRSRSSDDPAVLIPASKSVDPRSSGPRSSASAWNRTVTKLPSRVTRAFVLGSIVKVRRPPVAVRSRRGVSRGTEAASSTTRRDLRRISIRRFSKGSRMR